MLWEIEFPLVIQCLSKWIEYEFLQHCWICCWVHVCMSTKERASGNFPHLPCWDTLWNGSVFGIPCYIMWLQMYVEGRQITSEAAKKQALQGCLKLSMKFHFVYFLLKYKITLNLITSAHIQNSLQRVRWEYALLSFNKCNFSSWRDVIESKSKSNTVLWESRMFSS